MKSKENIDRLVEETLDSGSGIKAVKAPPFFKEKVLNKMAQANMEKEGVRYLNWLTPRYQAALLVALVIINTVALLSSTTDDNYVENVENFESVSIYSIKGQLVYQSDEVSKTMDVKKLATGMYSLSAVDFAGKIYQAKFVVK